MEMVTYRVKGKAVVISGWHGGDFTIDVPNIKAAIENVKTSRDSYANETAYLRHLALYENALDYAVNMGLPQ